MDRRRITALVAAGVLATGLAACSDDDAATGSGSPSGATPTATTGTAAAFPVSIEHAWGTAQIKTEPKRVVSLGYQDQDTILALGVKPIAARYWFGPEEDVFYPWADEAVGDDSDVEIVQMIDGIDVEEVAALRPDLIVGVYSDIDQASYDKLAKIAPVIARPKEFIDYGTPWQDQVLITGKALGRTDKAQELVDDLEARFADLQADHPEWVGKEVAIATRGEGDNVGAFASQDPRARMFRALGFAIPKAYDDRAGEVFFADFSNENAKLLDVDLIVWDQLSYADGGQEGIESDPILNQLQATKDGRVVYLPNELEDAFAFNTVLSLPFVLDRLVPMLEKALGGNGSSAASPSPSPSSTS